MFKHAEIMRAWLDGKPVQFLAWTARTDPGVWTDCKTPEQTASAGLAPHFHPDTPFRLKPETRKYRVALLRSTPDKTYTMNVESLGGELYAQNQYNFIRWLTDWIEYEV